MTKSEKKTCAEKTRRRQADPEPIPSRRLFFTRMAGACAVAVVGASCRRLTSKPHAPELALGEAEFQPLLEAGVRWFDAQQVKLLAEGRRLSADEMALARKVGVRAADRIRIVEADAIPFPTEGVLAAFLQRLRFQPDGIIGLTCGHGVCLRKKPPEGVDIRAHEFRHVAQFECLGSTRGFVFVYLKEMIHFPYGSGPLEVDAREAARLGAAAE